MRTFILAMSLSILPVGALAAQGRPTGAVPPTLRVEGVGEPASADVALHRGYAAYPAWTLRSLGARVENTSAGGAVIFGVDTLEFHAGSPFFRVGGEPWQLVEPPYREGGVLFLPHQLFAEWLPRAYPDRVSYESGRLRLGGGSVAGAGARPAAPPPAAADRQPAAGPIGVATATPLVIIDPGHGGRDPGAVGPSGLKEKEVVLQVSKRLAKVLAERGYDIRMTRSTDTLIDLYERAPMANEWRGNRPALFLSIHANYVSDRRVQGYETFFLSDARTEDEARVAEMENAAAAYDSSERVAASDDLGFIRNNLRNDFYIRASYDLAGLVQEQLGGFHQGRNRGVKQAGLVVLIGAFMPAVLIELAFISNPQEERQLGSGSFQVELAEGIANAVDRFFERQGERWTGGGF